MECHKEKNLESCNCSYESCSRKGTCCECIRYHVESRQLPACCFSSNIEKTYDRSFERFAQLVSNHQI